MGLTWLILAKVPRFAWGTLAALFVIFLAYNFGSRNKASEIAKRELESYRETTRKIDSATSADSNANAARERLRDKFGKWTSDM
ncbi:hypothetical protein GFB49_11695 [Epibacterium sp. SM1979]|uniref:Uncharacterized protein n=1 Tax=Tritonibacter litoralis TaxID=2662264 RepID=A0A843YCR0_9RHOB|nr:hypothetical protein [Tritonibacter litoralis]MQQ09120.1 hypothetical protein [Tritonibacter litoralis]